MSYRRKHVKSKIHRIKPKKSVFRRPVFWIIFFLLVIALAVFYAMVFYFKFQVSDIIISGNQKAPAEDIKSLISNDINIKIFSIGNWEVVSKSIFLVNTDTISKEVFNKYPVIENVKISKKLPNTLSVEIIERDPAGVFCLSSAECFFIDGNGVVFEPSYAIPQDMVIVRQATNKSQIIVGEKVVEQNIMRAISMIEKNLKDDFEIDVKEAFIASFSQLNIKTDENWLAYFNISQDSNISLQIAKINLLLKGEISAEARKKLQYIDLRFKDRAYYK